MSIDILIVGCGVFGLSTAYHLAKRGGYKITCIDKHPCPSVDSAAHDINKIVRTEYDDPIYTGLAIEALKAWRGPLWKGIFHETGWLTAAGNGNSASEKFFENSSDNLKKYGQDGDAVLLEGREKVLERVPQLAKAKGLDSWKGLWNGRAGWAHSGRALAKLAREANNLGVDFVHESDGAMVGFEVADARVTGIKVASGKIHHASRYIISIGAGTAQLLPELASQLRPTCWSLAHLKLNEQETQNLAGMPVIDSHELGYFFEPDR